MAFPTSGLSNNQVHKEGNRAFVYDSTLGVWDQIRETDSTENRIIDGEIGSNVRFPPGHIIQMVGHTDNTFRTGSVNAPIEGVRKAIVSTVADSNYYISGGCASFNSNAHGAIGIFKNGIAQSNLIFSTSNADNSGTNRGWHGSRVSFQTDSSYRLEQTISNFYNPGTVAAGTVITFFIGILGYYHASATMKLNENTNPTPAQSNITIMEIAP